MSNFDLEWVASEQPHLVGQDPGARDRARIALMRHAAAAGGRARRPALLRFLRRPLLGAAATAGLAAAAVGVVAVLHSGGSASGVTAPGIAASGARTRAIHIQHSGSPLARLAAYVSASAPPATGDATLEVRTTVDGSGAPITVYDLYTDSGQCYFSRTRAGLPAQLQAHNDQGGDIFAREIAAARLAASGDVKQAAVDMVQAPDPAHAAPAPGGPLWDNWLWENSLDAITAGAGDPQVRAGVLKLIATLPGVTVTTTTVSGQPALSLLASGPELGADYIEQLTIDAQTGVPIRFEGGATGQAPSTIQAKLHPRLAQGAILTAPPAGWTPAITVTYRVSRVTTADLVSGGGTSS